MSSELSDALNPYLSQRSRNPNAYQEQLQPVVQTPQQYVPHRSELELAVSEPPPNANTPITRPSPEGIQAVQELLRIVSQTSQAQEVERKRRIAWEQEQEARLERNQAEMERQVTELRQELGLIRSVLNVQGPSSTQASPLMFPVAHTSQAQTQAPTPAYSASSISPVSQHSDVHQSAFVQGSSTQPLPNEQQALHPSNPLLWRPIQQHQQQHPSPPLHSLTPSTSATPAPSPRSTHNSSSRKRRKTIPSSNNSDSDSSQSSDSSVEPVISRRKSHHDKRCYTIHKAMRTHILHLMELDGDKELPDSHNEGTALETSQPVRFVWDKTPKQSVHNARMKKRVLEDLKTNRRKYKHVPDKEFNQKSLDASFDQCFTTLRQKFKTQRDSRAAESQKRREDAKAKKSRRLSRKKNKLNCRSEARLRITTFEHVTFDGAFQLECMSSEESDVEDGGGSSQTKYFRTHGYAWRSTRLTAFFSILDQEDSAAASSQAKRGVGRTGRVVGSVREGLHLPPKGVASWMISKRWLSDTRGKPPDFHSHVEKLIEDPLGFDWNSFHELGEESEDEQLVQQQQQHQPAMMNMAPNHQMQSVQMPMAQYTTTSSLHYALS
ncbi:hypothetical protein K435DRAFT_958967 [Dendrothele bispora CBS 962.96]|uniref:Uncharacterized protein n=1 Tax=Dendrothele bispora (strain CBS 962.96) TaxID=1314807 RepID=A0A4S8MYY3_DENBC|nr:hypothetical protein K435DRAFT_958967 [Dendrothele bispora CBS 962.96]